MKTSKYIEDSDEEGDKEYKPTKRTQSDNEEEFEEEEQEVKKQKREVAKKSETTGTLDKNGHQYFELSNKRRITIRPFPSGEPSVDIREVYKDKTSGEMKPGKSGVTLPMAQWKKLKELLPEIDEAIKALEK